MSLKDSTKVFSVTVTGGCHSQGCHGYPQFTQVPSPHSSIGEHEKLWIERPVNNYSWKLLRGSFLSVLFICYFISVKSKIFVYLYSVPVKKASSTEKPKEEVKVGSVIKIIVFWMNQSFAGIESTWVLSVGSSEWNSFFNWCLTIFTLKFTCTLSHFLFLYIYIHNSQTH